MHAFNRLSGEGAAEADDILLQMPRPCIGQPVDLVGRPFAEVPGALEMMILQSPCV
jgi:hypothetical protein